MSIEALSVVLHHSQAKGAAKLVLLGIANHYHADDDRGAWPSQTRLASYANITDRGVRKAIESLQLLGELTVESHGGPGKTRNKPNRYWITLRCPDDCDGSMNHRSREELDASTTGTFGDDRNSVTSRPEPQFRRTVIEPEGNNHNLKGPKNADEYEPSEAIKNTFEERWPGLRLDIELVKFRNHHMAKGSKFKLWDRAFVYWLERASEWSPEAKKARAWAEWEKQVLQLEEEENATE